MQEQLAYIALALVLPAFACSAGDGHEDTEHGGPGHETEIISTIELTFTPDGGGDVVVARFEDPDGDGGVSGTADPIALTAMTSYTLDIRFSNELDTPAEDITEEIEAEAEEHLVFIGGDAPITQAYADVESDYGANAEGDDLPVGLSHTISTDAAGMGQFQVVLRHLPELNMSPQKTADLPQMFADGASLPGDVDADVRFELTVE